MIRSDPRNPKGIVWLASYPKSGNTWLRIFLYQLMRIASGRPREKDEINKLDRISTYETRLVPIFERFLGKPLATATTLEMMRVRARVQASIADRMPATSLVKTHNLLGMVKGMPTINMAVSVGAIYVLRDPRDVAASLVKFLDCTLDQAITVLNTSGYVTGNSDKGAGEVWGSWSEHVLSWTTEPNEAVLVVRYEDMLGKPTETFTAIANHLRQRATAEQIDEAIHLSSFERLQRQEQQTGFTERTQKNDRFFATGTSGGWRNKLTAEQAALISATHGEQMKRFAYID